MYTRLINLFFLTYFFVVSTTQAEVYKWTDENGRIHYSDKKPGNQSSEEVKIRPHTQAVTQPIPQGTETKDPKSLNTEEDLKPYKKKQKVTMYGASWCGYCKSARAYFKKNKIRYTEYDIDKNANARKRYEKLGGTGVPLIVAKRKQM